MESRELWLIAGISLLTAIASVLLLLVYYSEDNSSQAYAQAVLNSKTLVFEVNGEPKAYEIPEAEPSDEAWLEARREKINELNAIRYEYNAENEKELMEDRKKSENWSVYMNGEIIQGYDVIRMERGDFAEKLEPKRDEVRSRAALARGYY